MKNNPYSALLLIPILIVINIIILILSSLIDTQLIPWASNSGGHPVPVFTLLAFIVMPIIDIIGGIIAVVITVIRVTKAKNK